MAFHKKFAHIEKADKLNLSLSLKQIENTADIYRYMLKCNFLVWKLLCLDSNFTEIQIKIEK